MKRISILTVLVALILSACNRERPEIVFRTLDPGFRDLPTRSLLTAPDIETKKTGITLAAYGEDGLRAVSRHFTAALDALVLELDPSRTYMVYALVNMGDMTSSITRLASVLELFT